MFTEDLTPFFDLAGFAYEATWTPAAGGGPYSVQVIFDNPDYNNSLGDAGDTGLAPRCMASDVQLAQGAGITRNDSLVINGTTYKVADINPDGTGVTTLVLRN